LHGGILAGPGPAADHIDRGERQGCDQPGSTGVPGINRKEKRRVRSVLRFSSSHPEGTRSFLGNFKMMAGHAKFEGDRLDVSFDGLALGIFQGDIHYFCKGLNRAPREILTSGIHTEDKLG
jgi:hypothetical protein